jgi:hypothetical protein
MGGYKYTRCSRGKGIETKELCEILAESKPLTPLYFAHKVVSRKKIYEALGLTYRHKESIEVNKMIEYFRSKLKGEHVFFIKVGGLLYLFEKEKANV